MALTKFHLFRSLPPELRQKIYILATPPRVVHIQERTKEDYEDFEAVFRTTPVQLKLDPTLAYFAFNWRRLVPFRSSQSTLESFGFSGKPPHRPWVPSTSTPHIPLHWLGEHPEIAWELTRESFLYSNAPIPPLLHTCYESRAALMGQGYQLAFRTRSSQPRTWFNFDRDVLFLEFNRDSDLSYPNLLSDGPWDVGQFDPRDLRRVRKLALDRSVGSLPDRALNGAQFNHLALDREVSTILRLFGGLKELLLVEWDRRDIVWWTEFSPAASPSLRDRHREQCIMDSAREIWSCIAVEEIDALVNLFLEGTSLALFSAGENGELLKAHKQTNGWTAPFFRDMELRVEGRLGNHRDSVMATNDDGSVTPWELPKITTVHVLPQSMFCFLSELRLRVVEELCKLKKEWASVTKLKAPTPSTPSAPSAPSAPPAPSPSSDSSALLASPGYWADHSMHAEDYYDDGYYYSMRFKDAQKNWWIQEGPIPALGGHDLFQ
ncbi:hypothetical protein DL765_010256 [Monosporascus sp. GIB2]|nr:hypothetical protein DL765_010256 [Monosporascus sp. GIB2]